MGSVVFAHVAELALALRVLRPTGVFTVGGEAFAAMLVITAVAHTLSKVFAVSVLAVDDEGELMLPLNREDCIIKYNFTKSVVG